ncbi:uncharacterized protein LOC135806113 [Sycon ciliatum]|uniref:uncharacterized protein LOC135806113 n=1 Tax=Sycon ciliatum TaxID=27933 RepID=UPI0020AC5F10|eukprot:scpid35693/ scgid9468/ Nuclear factor erythroid 2-related factor 2; Nuclear factor, erythroid derived 2, like 2
MERENDIGMSVAGGTSTADQGNMEQQAVSDVNDSDKKQCCVKLDRIPKRINVALPIQSFIPGLATGPAAGSVLPIFSNTGMPLYLGIVPASHQQQQQRTAPVGVQQRQAGETVTVDKVVYKVGPTMCRETKVNLLKSADVCNPCVCKSEDGCERCEDRYSTVAQTDRHREDGDTSSITERSEVAPSISSIPDVHSERGYSIGEDEEASSVTSDVNLRYGRRAARAPSQASQQSYERESRARTHSGRPQGRGVQFPNSLAAILKQSKSGGADEEGGLDEDDINVLTAITGSPPGSHDDVHTANSDVHSQGNADWNAERSAYAASSMTASTRDGGGAAGAIYSDDSDDDDDPTGKKVLMRSPADIRVVEKLFGLSTVSTEEAMRIATMPVQELNKLMQQAGLSDADSSLVRDIRRRGKNKVAARNCRKRKIENIEKLEGEVDFLNSKRESLLDELRKVKTDTEKYKKCVQRIRHFMIKKRGHASAGSQTNLSTISAADINTTNALAASGSLGQDYLSSVPFSATSTDSSVFTALDGQSEGMGSTSNLLAASSSSLQHQRQHQAVQRTGSGGSNAGEFLSVPAQLSVISGMNAMAGYPPASLPDGSRAILDLQQLTPESPPTSSTNATSVAGMYFNTSNQGVTAMTSLPGVSQTATNVAPIPAGIQIQPPFQTLYAGSAGTGQNVQLSVLPQGTTWVPAQWPAAAAFRPAMQ